MAPDDTVESQATSSNREHINVVPAPDTTAQTEQDHPEESSEGEETVSYSSSNPDTEDRQPTVGSDTETEDFPHEEESDVVEADSLDEEESDEERPKRNRKPKPFFTYDELGKSKVSRLRSILKKTDGEREKNFVSNSGAPPDNSEYEPPHNSLK